MNLIKRFRNAASTKTTRFDIDDRVDAAIHNTTRANENSVRIMTMFQDTLAKLKAHAHARQH